MFTFLIQLIDLLTLQQVGLFLVFFITTWAVYLYKLYKASKFDNYNIKQIIDNPPSVTVIIPVVDEPMRLWKQVLLSMKDAVKNLDHEIIVVPNGDNGKRNAEMAVDMGFKVIYLKNAGKRRAIHAAAKVATKKITVILDSDTIVRPDSIEKLISRMTTGKIGGATPKHIVFNREKNIYRRISDWLEDIRFEEIVKGQGVSEAISCLPGRLLAIRTDLLKGAVDGLISQKFLGKECISGDDRYLTSWLLERGYRTIYVPESVVETDSPDTLEKFLKQRLRWSRTSLRESIRALTWSYKYPYMTMVTWAAIVLRWFYLIIIANFGFFLAGYGSSQHYLNLPLGVLVVGTLIGFFISGFLRHLRHFTRYPQDIIYLPAFLLVTTIGLTSVEWYGNLSIKESGWMTREV